MDQPQQRALRQPIGDVQHTVAELTKSIKCGHLDLITAYKLLGAFLEVNLGQSRQISLANPRALEYSRPDSSFGVSAGSRETERDSA